MTDGSGNDVSVNNNHMGNINPLRYRGYYYDTETGFYYLNSRYYDPETGRFINADGVIGSNQDLISYNLYAYCGNNPVNRSDPSGAFWSELWESIKQSFSYLAPAYGACGGVALSDGPLPFGDILAIGAAAILTVGALGYGFYQAVQAPSTSVPKVEEKEEVIPSKPSRGGKTYYHVTTPENATLIKTTGIMTGSSWEGGYVFAWEDKPNKYAIENSGARQGVVISFKTSASFVDDKGILDPKVTKYNPVVSAAPGPITVWDVQIVG